jgi:hypothetical protein
MRWAENTSRMEVTGNAFRIYWNFGLKGRVNFEDPSRLEDNIKVYLYET